MTPAAARVGAGTHAVHLHRPARRAPPTLAGGGASYLTGFDSLRGDMALPVPYGPRRRMWQVVVADEAQRIKNAHTAIAATVKALPRRHAWALTGTPLENCPDDAVSILDFVAPGLHDPAEMVAGLRRALSVVQLRRRRAAVLPDLSPKTVFELAPELLPAQRTAYDTAHREGLVWLRSLGAELRVTHMLELILRLKQICNACPRTGASAKLDDLRRRLHAVAAAGEKALVFSQFVAAPFGAEAIVHAIKSLRPLLLTGRMSRPLATTPSGSSPPTRTAACWWLLCGRAAWG